MVSEMGILRDIHLESENLFQIQEVRQVFLVADFMEV